MGETGCLRHEGLRRRTSSVMAAVLTTALLAGAATSAAARPADLPPWGPRHLVVAEVVRPEPQVATSSRGASVVTWLARRPDGSYRARAAVRSRRGQWSRPVDVGGAFENASGLTPVPWGDGSISVFWQREISTDDWQFRMRTFGREGWGPIRTLLTAKYAFPGFRVDVSLGGTILLAWENGDHRVRVATLAPGGRWDRLRPIAIRSPGTTFRFIANPQAAFVAEDGGVRVLTWGKRHGTSGKAVWLARLDRHRAWRYQRIAPIGGDRLEYNWVDQARFAADGVGDIVSVWSQQDPQTHVWTTLLRYDVAGPGRGGARVLGHARCDPDWTWCADAAVSATGTAIVSWARRGPGAQDILVARRPRHGSLTAPRTIYSETVPYVFSGVTVTANEQGDATVHFTGGNAQVLRSEFVRCPAGQTCHRPVSRQDWPSWLDRLDIAVAPNGGTTVAWATGCAGGEACRPDQVWARHLRAAR